MSETRSGACATGFAAGGTQLELLPNANGIPSPLPGVPVLPITDTSGALSEGAWPRSSISGITLGIRVIPMTTPLRRLLIGAWSGRDAEVSGGGPGGGAGATIPGEASNFSCGNPSV